MHFVKIPAIFSTVTNLGCIRSRIFSGTVFSKNIKKNILTTFISRVIFSTMSMKVVLKIFKHCINVRFVSIVYRSVAQPRFCRAACWSQAFFLRVSQQSFNKPLLSCATDFVLQ